MKTDSPAPDNATVEDRIEGVNDPDELADRAVRIIFGSRLPHDDRYKLLGFKERIAKLHSQFQEEDCCEADQVLFDYRFFDEPALHTDRFHINDALRRLTGKESPHARANTDRRKTFANQREKLLIRYFHLAQSRDKTGALIHPELHDHYGNIRMTLADVNKVLFGTRAKRLSKDRFTAAWKFLWSNEVARVRSRTGYHDNVRWVRVDWERWHGLLVDRPTQPQESDKAPDNSTMRELSSREIERALARLHSYPLKPGEEPKQVTRVKKLRISDPLADRWFDIQCWVHNRPNPWFFKQPADHEVRGQAFEPLIKSCCRIFAPTRKGTFRGATYTNRTGALVKLISAKELCYRAGVTARQLRYEMHFIHGKQLGVSIERTGRDLLAISLRAEDLYYVREHIDRWKRQMPSEWVEPTVVTHSTDQAAPGSGSELDFDENRAVFAVNRADNASASNRLLEIDVAFAGLPVGGDSYFYPSEIASFPFCPLRELEQLKPIPGSRCHHSFEGAKKEDCSPTVQSKTGEPVVQPRDESRSSDNPRKSSDVARFYGDDDAIEEAEHQPENDFWHQPWNGWLPREYRQMLDMLQERLAGGQFTNGMVRNLRKLAQLSSRWRLTPERLHNFLDLIDDKDASVPFWLSVVPVEQLLTVSTWKYAIRVTCHELLLQINPAEKLFALRKLAFADLEEASTKDIGYDLCFEYFTTEELQLFGRDPRALIRRLRLQAVEEFCCGPAIFDCEDLKGEGQEFAALFEEAKTLAVYEHLQNLCQLPSRFLRKEHSPDASYEDEAPVPITPAFDPEPVVVPLCTAAEASFEEPVKLPAKKPVDMCQTMLPSLPPFPDKWCSPETPVLQFPLTPTPVIQGALTTFGHSEDSSSHGDRPLIPPQNMTIHAMLHSRFRFNDSPKILEAIESLAALTAPWDLSAQRVYDYFALWDAGKLPSSCKTKWVSRLLHPHFWRRVATYVNYYPG